MEKQRCYMVIDMKASFELAFFLIFNNQTKSKFIKIVLDNLFIHSKTCLISDR